jgi:prepilin-type N-terminal cleavage/methylation domain-containing protein
MKKAFTLIELLLVVMLLLGFATAMVVSVNGVSDRERYNHSKEQFKNYLTYTKYKAVDTQTNASVYINVENNSVSSPFDYEIEWLMDFTDDITILNSSETNIVFNMDGSLNTDVYVDIASKDGAYSNRLYLSPIGLFRYVDP